MGQKIINLPEHLWKIAEIVAQNMGQTVEDVLIDAIEGGLTGKGITDKLAKVIEELKEIERKSEK